MRGKAFYSMSKETWKQFKSSENDDVSASLIWGCAALLLFEIVMLILLLSEIVDHGLNNSGFLLTYHISMLSVFTLSIIILSIRESHKEIKWLRKINVALMLSLLALAYSVIYTIYMINIDGQIVVYAFGLIFCVYFLRERPLINTSIFMLSLLAINVSAVIMVSDEEARQSIIFNCSIVAVVTVFISMNIFKYRIKSFFINDKLNKLVTKDTLTGLNNRFSYNQYISENKICCPAVVCVLDTDNLKVINDTYGHLEGDKALIAIAKGLCSAFEFSFLARTGGDEFVVIIGSSTLKEVFPKIEKFRNIISKGTQDIPQVSVSLGYSKLKKNASYNEAFIKAEQMMYNEKLEKKNILNRRNR